MAHVFSALCHCSSRLLIPPYPCQPLLAVPVRCLTYSHLRVFALTVSPAQTVAAPSVPGVLMWILAHAQLCLTLCDPMDDSLSGSSVRGILQTRILKWVAMPSCRGILPTQGSNPSLLHLLHWQAYSLPLHHLESLMACSVLSFWNFSQMSPSLWSPNNVSLQPSSTSRTLPFFPYFIFSITLFNVTSVSSGQLLSRVWLFATPWTAERQASLSITNSHSLLKLMSIESVTPSNHLILCRPHLLCLQSFPASGSFPMSQVFKSGLIIM